MAAQLPNSDSHSPPAVQPTAGPAVVLIGLRGSGKSTVGQALAQRLKIPFIDLDDLVLAKFEGYTSVAEVWERLGEGAWRIKEADVVLSQMAHRGDFRRVLALGGGSPMIDTVHGVLHGSKNPPGRHRATIFYLRGSAELLADRLLARPGDRPPLTEADNLLDEIRQVLGQRDTVYQQLAHRVIELCADEVVDELVDRLLALLEFGN